MIITDPTKKPSERFIEVIENYFISNNYRFIKGQKSYVQLTTDGFEKIELQFYTNVNLVSVSVSWSKSLLVIEKLFSMWRGQTTAKYKKEITIHTDLFNYTKGLPNRIHTWELFDNKTHKCDDFNLDKASKGIIDTHQTQIIPFFEYYNNYENLESVLNTLPIKPTPFAMGYLGYDKHIAIGLLLAHYFGRGNFNHIVKGYKIFAMSKEVLIKNNILHSVNKTLDFITKNDIKAALRK